MRRSLHFVPGGNEKMIAKALTLPADGLILDLEDAVTPDRKAATRPIVRGWLQNLDFGGRERWVRMSPIFTDHAEADIAETIAGRPDGYVVPKPRRAEDVRRVAALLDAQEQAKGVPFGSTRLVLIATETPAGLLHIQEIAGASPRTVALSWGIEDLSAAMGLPRTRARAAHRGRGGAPPPRGGRVRVEGADDGHAAPHASPQDRRSRETGGGALSRARVAALIGVLLVSALVVFALPVGRRPLVNQDEARFALLAREGVEHGQWLLPRVRGVIYLNKPPLYFWTVGLLALPFGVVDERTAPIASVLSALAALLAGIALGRRHWSPEVGLAGAMVLATAPYFYFMSHQVLSDMMMTAWLAWALYFLVTARATPTPTGHLVGFYLCVAGALATKGPAALTGLAGALALRPGADGCRRVRWRRLPTG